MGLSCPRFLVKKNMIFNQCEHFSHIASKTLWFFGMLELILLEWRCKWVKFISSILKALKEQKCNDNENLMKNENDDVKTFEF
jgi:hypothetical protein